MNKEIDNFTGISTYKHVSSGKNLKKKPSDADFIELFPHEAKNFTTLIVTGFPITIRDSTELELFFRNHLPNTKLNERFGFNLEKQSSKIVHGGSNKLIFNITTASHMDALFLKDYLEKFLPNITVSW